MSGDMLEVEGKITRCERGDVYRVEVDMGGTAREVICKRSGRLNQHHIRLTANDRVKVEVSPYDMTRGRIVFRL